MRRRVCYTSKTVLSWPLQTFRALGLSESTFLCSVVVFALGRIFLRAIAQSLGSSKRLLSCRFFCNTRTECALNTPALRRLCCVFETERLPILISTPCILFFKGYSSSANNVPLDCFLFFRFTQCSILEALLTAHSISPCPQAHGPCVLLTCTNATYFGV